MGWSIYLRSNQVIQEQEIDDIVDQLPEKFSSTLGNSRQTWGWSTGADIDLRDKQTLRLGGSYEISGDIAEDYAVHMRNELKSRGHIITPEFHW